MADDTSQSGVAAGAAGGAVTEAPVDQEPAPEGRAAPESAAKPESAPVPESEPGPAPFAPIRRQAAGNGGPLLGVWAAAICAIAIAAVGLVGILLHQPWVFPSLGPTLMVILETPSQPAAHPRNVLVGHVVGVAAGFLALVLTGLRTAPSTVQAGLDGQRLLAAVIALAVTVLVLQVLRTPHAPAGATTLIVGLGILKTPGDLTIIVLSVLLCTLIASAANVVAAVRQTGVTDAPRRRPRARS